MFDLLMLMAHKQYYVRVTLNKHRYSSDRPMQCSTCSTVILAPLVEATVNETL